eukprot:1059396-Karenia_brevis.AAC.2
MSVFIDSFSDKLLGEINTIIDSRFNEVASDVAVLQSQLRAVEEKTLGLLQKSQGQQWKQRASSSSVKPSSLKEGCNVRLFGLNTTNLNGKRGMVISDSKNGRYGISLEDGTFKSIKAENLEVVEAERYESEFDLFASDDDDGGHWSR